MDGKFHIVREKEREAWRLRCFGVFDGTSAWELRRAMSKLRRTPLVVDFAGVSELHEFGLAVLAAHFVSRKGRAVTFEGLDAEGQRALRSHGLGAERLGEPMFKPHPVLGYIEPIPQT